MNSFLEIEAEHSRFDASKIVIIPVPYEATTSYGRGAKNGPKAILDASQIVEDFDIELGYEPYKKLGVHTYPPVKFGKDPHEAIYNAVKEVVSLKKIPILLGGEHSISYGAVKAVKKYYPDLSVLQFDAHSDLRDSYHGSKFSHASIMRRVHEMCSFVAVGIRSQDIEESSYIKEKGISGSVFYSHDLSESKIPAIIKNLSDNVYITLDVDVFDPSIIPATGTPEPGGLNWHQVLNVLKAVISSRKIAALDIVELSPKPGLYHADYTVAKLIYKIIGYLSKT